MSIIKNSARKMAVFLIACAGLLAACMPEAPRALWDGKELLDKGRYPEAIERLKRATSLMPTNALAWNYLGIACHQGNQITNAVLAYQRALACNQDLMEAHYNLGCLWLEQGVPEKAKAEFTVYTMRVPESVNGWLQLGSAQSRLHELPNAEKSFSEAIRLDPKNPAALNEMGMLQIERNRPREALRFFESALRARPDFAPAMLNRAIVFHHHLENHPLALQQYREYLALPNRPDNWDSVNATARELERELNPPPLTRQPAPATSAPPVVVVTNVPKITSNAVARVVAPPRPDPSTNRVHLPATNAPAPTNPTPVPTRVEVVTVPPEPILKPARDVSSTSPSSARVESNESTASNTRIDSTKARASTNSDRTSDEVSIPPVTRSESIAVPGGAQFPRYTYRHPAKPVSGDRSAAQRALAQGVQAQGARRLPEAIQAYRQAAQLDPACYEAYYNLGLALASAGSLQQSLSAYETAIAIRPESIDARYNFALALKQANYVVDAANELEKLLASYPNEARSHLAVGTWYAGPLNQPSKAREHFLKVLEIDPSNPQAPVIRNWLSSPGP
jgi:tetratricopeptide (TPR) repeat protein